jgi:hypothetical protein
MKTLWSGLVVAGLLMTGKHKSSEDFKVTVDRGKDFKEDVAIKVAVDPAGKGVTATVEPADVKASAPGEVHVKTV